jgi:hypothetical protein
MQNRPLFKPVAMAVGCAAVVATLSACEPCLGAKRTETTLTASLSGGANFSVEAPASGGAMDDTRSWETTIRDASTGPPGIGLVGLQFRDISDVALQQLLLTLPFPLSRNQSLAIVSSPAAQGRPTFSFVPTDDPNGSPPTDAVGLWFLSGPNRTDFEADREQVSSGTLEVTSVSPLRLHLAATVTYPVSGRPSRSFDGDVVFAISRTSMCVD